MRFLSAYIGNKILSLVGVVILLNLVGLIVFYAKHQEQSILEQNFTSMDNLAESVSRGLQTIMLNGYADIAQAFAGELKKVKSVRDFRIMRIAGDEAFQDNETIDQVNRRIGEEEFIPREQEKSVPILAADNPYLKQALATQARVSYYGTDNGEDTLTFLVPISNESRCYRCHGKDYPVRGVLKLTTSLESAHRAIEETRSEAIRILVGAILGSFLLIHLLIRFSVVRPIKGITSAMTEVAKGDFSQRVPVLSRDELAQMANAFNVMSDEVLRSHSWLKQEQNKLTTIILSAKEAIIVTNAGGQIVLLNPAAERILEKDHDQIVQGGFLNIIDDREYVSAFLERNGHGMPDTLVYKNRILNFYAATIKNADGESTGSAALIRDVTEEKKLEEKLKAMSYTDKLTGLYNRRRMEDLLEAEYSRANRYSLTLSVLFFDVDHFKKFNDTYGHDMGDRVLEEIGKAAKDHFRNVDYPCRYGGEEFCIILPNTPPDGAFMAAERFRERIEAMEVDGVHVTISIGVATFPFAATKTWEELLKISDNALYEGKRAGRNRVILWRDVKKEMLTPEGKKDVK